MTVEWVEEELGPPADQPPGRRRFHLPRPRWWFALGALVLGGLAGAFVGRATAPATDSGGQRFVSGAVVTASFGMHVNSPPVNATSGPAEQCVGVGEADGLQAGTPVVITDIGSHVLGATFLGYGQLTTNGRGCRFPFQLLVSEAAADLYRVQVGNRPAAAVHGNALDALRIRIAAP